MPIRLALLPLKLFRRITRGASRSGPSSTMVLPRRGGPLRWLMGRWWAWVAFGLFVAFMNRSRHNERRERSDADTRTTVEAPAVTEPSAAPEGNSPGHPGHKGSVSDSELEAGVEKALKGSKLTKAEEIEVDADEGTVTLSGAVSAPLVSQLAQALAESVPGVKRVQNNLAVTDGHEGPPGPGWPDLTGIPFLHPPEPGSPEAKALAELLEKGQEALKADRPEEALGVFGAALALDPKNRVARRGLEQATRNMKKRAIGGPAPPAAPTPPP
jgi:hypothetical protein